MIKCINLRNNLSATTVLAGGLLLLAAPAAAQNLPDTGNVTSVTAGISGGAPGSTNPVFTTSGAVGAQTLKVDLKDNRTILTWGSGFDVATGNSVNFKDSRETSGVTGRTDNIAVLNRDISGHASQVLGKITSDPNVGVYLINREGIYFGGQSSVNTGSFFASDIDLSNDNDFLNGSSTLRFSVSGSVNGGYGILFGQEGTVGTKITTTSNAGVTGGRMGDLVILGRRITEQGFRVPTLTANGGDVALVVARDVTIQNSPGSPLSLTVTTGVPDARLLLSGVTIKGRNVLIGAFGETATSIDMIDASITATGAALTDRGVVLTADVAVPGITIADDSVFAADGYIRAFNNSIVSAHDINLAASGRYQLGSIRAAGAADLYAGASDSTINSVEGKSANFYGNGPASVQNSVVTTGGDLSVTSSLFYAGSMNIAGNIVGMPSGSFISTGGATVAGTVSITADGIALQDLVANGKITLTSSKGVSGRSLRSTMGDLTLTGPTGIIFDTVYAGGKLNLTSDTQVYVGDGMGVGGVTIGSSTALLGLGNVAAGANADLVLNGLALISFNNGNITVLPTLSAGRDITVTTGGQISTKTIDAGRNLSITAVDWLSADKLTAASGDVSVTVTGGALSPGSGYNVSINSISAGTSASVSGLALYVGNATGGANLTLTAGEDVYLTSASSGGSIGVTATNGVVNVLGNITAGGDYAVSGKAGISVSGVQLAKGALTLATSSGGIWGYGVELRSNSDGIGNEALSLSALSDIVLRGGSKLFGGPMDQSDIAIRSGGEMLFQAGSNLSGRNLILSGATFINDAGSNLLTASGHWVIYLARPNGLNTYGNLDSHNTAIWNATLATRAPDTISGNRYVFAFQPTLTFSTVDFSKIYGVTLNGSSGIPFGITGYQPGIDGAFLADTSSTAFSGVPLIGSNGFAERATVAGGAYGTSITLGSLQSDAGYAFAFTNPGMLTVIPKAITGTVTANSKIYDGAATGSGTVALNGVLSGDGVGTTGTVFTFANKNAGIGKTVTVSGTQLTGDDSGNYALTFPTTVLADILQKALTGTITANNKVYDGTVTGTGAIVLNGVVSGDDVGTTGTMFSFANKNAATGKTVNVSGTTLSGPDAANYTLTLPASALADIFKKAIAGSISVNGKTYDGTTSATGVVTLNGVVAGDAVGTSGTAMAFADKNAGTGKTVNVSGTTLTGGDAGNYTLTIPTSAFADILKKP